MMFQFRILSDELDGSFVDLEPDNIYRAGNSFLFDIFLPYQQILHN